MSGEATVIADRDVVRKYYSPTLKAWVGDLGDGVHDGGPEDPRIAVIRVVARTATYAIAVGTSLGRGVEIIKGAVTGQPAEVNKLRELTEKELDECKSPAFAPHWIANAFCPGRPAQPMFRSAFLQSRALTIFTPRA